MSQSLYDSQHGMSSEELWARYRQYPWKDRFGNMVMQGEPNYLKGPVLPKNVKTYKAPVDKGFYTPGVGVTINSLLLRGQALKTLNHENQHDAQYKSGMLNDQKEPYDDMLSEAQARIVGEMSALPEAYKSIINPLNYTKMGGASVENFDTKQSGDYVGGLDLPIDKKLQLLEGFGSYVAPKKVTKDYTAEDMLQAKQKFGSKVSPSLMELLTQGREQYVPPFISQGMQK
jgi:hypothetical protein